MPFPFSDKTFQFETLRALGYANSEGADVGEVLQVCQRIDNGNLQQWFEEWREAGDRAFKHGEESERSLDRVSARSAFLRASNYLRTAEFFRRDSTSDDQEALQVFNKSREAMYCAMALSPQYTFQRIAAPFEDTKLPAYLICPAQKDGRNPTLVLNGGFDSTKEEGYLAVGAAALARGYNFAAFDGPGQGEMIRQQRIPFRPDWHTVVTAVTDAIVDRDEVDKDRLILMGWSMGGWLAAEAATRELRYAALILNDGVYDFAAGWRKRVPWWVWRIKDLGYTSIGSFLISCSVQGNTGKSWAFQNALLTFGASEGVSLLDKIVQYSLSEESVRLIRCPMLVLDPQDDHLLGGQPAELCKHFSADQHYDHVVFETRWGASQHCQAGAPAEQDRVVFNWLAKILRAE